MLLTDTLSTVYSLKDLFVKYDLDCCNETLQMDKQITHRLKCIKISSGLFTVFTILEGLHSADT